MRVPLIIHRLKSIVRPKLWIRKPLHLAHNSRLKSFGFSKQKKIPQKQIISFKKKIPKHSHYQTPHYENPYEFSSYETVSSNTKPKSPAPGGDHESSYACDNSLSADLETKTIINCKKIPDENSQPPEPDDHKNSKPITVLKDDRKTPALPIVTSTYTSPSKPSIKPNPDIIYGLPVFSPQDPTVVTDIPPTDMPTLNPSPHESV